MGGNYEKGMYLQLMDVMARLDIMETEHQKDRKEISSLTAEVKILRKENTQLRTELAQVKGENSALRKENAAFLYSEGVVSNDRIAAFLHSLSGDALDISTGSIYHFCREFSEGSAAVRPQIEQELLNAGKICTDATGVKQNGKQECLCPLAGNRIKKRGGGLPKRKRKHC